MAAAQVQPWEVLLSSIPCDMVKEWREGSGCAISQIDHLVYKRNKLVQGDEQVSVAYGGGGDFGRAHGVMVKVHKGHVIAEYDKMLRQDIEKFRTNLALITQALDLVESTLPQ